MKDQLGPRMKAMAGVAYLLGVVCFALASPVAAQEPAKCLIYAVHDERDANSQFFTIDLFTNTPSALGDLIQDGDFEGLDIHPGTSMIYATAGSGGDFDGNLYIVDAQTGALTFVGNTGFIEVVALSFRTFDASLWGWSQDNGLISIDTATGAGSLVFASAVNVEGLAWNNDGSLLYASDGNKLWVYDPAGPTFTQKASNLPGTVEGLEMLVNGHLLGGIHETTTVSVFAYDPVALEVVASESITSPYNDVEGLAWPESCEVPPLDDPTPTPTDTPPGTTPTATETPTELPPTPTATPTELAPPPPPPPPIEEPPNNPAPTQPAPTQSLPPQPAPTQTSVNPTVSPPVPIPVTGGAQSPFLIPVTGVDFAGQTQPARGLFQNLGLAFLGLGLGMHGLSLRQPREE